MAGENRSIAGSIKTCIAGKTTEATVAFKTSLPHRETEAPAWRNITHSGAGHEEVAFADRTLLGGRLISANSTATFELDCAPHFNRCAP